MRKQYKKQLSINENFINLKFFKKLAKKNHLKLKAFYVSNKAEKVRNAFGNFLASEIVGVFSLR